jgi:iron complex outermembrane receptor protein
MISTPNLHRVAKRLRPCGGRAIGTACIATAIGLVAAMRQLAQAADDDQGTTLPRTQLPTLTVTATTLVEPTAPALDQAREEIDGVPGGATLVVPDQYRSGATGSLSRLLDAVPGVFAVSQAGGQETRISIRGSGIQSDDILGITFLQDGIPINEGDGEADIEELDLGNIAYLQVFRGANALRYGGLGLGGAINLVSMTGRDAPALSGRFEGGSYGYHLEHAEAGFATGPYDFIITLGDQHVDGYREHSEEDVQRVVSNFGYRISSSWENRLYASYVWFNRQLPDDLTSEQLQQDPRQTGQQSLDQDVYRKWSEVRASDKLSFVNGLQSFDIALSASHRWWREQDLYDLVDNPQGIWIYQSNGLTGDATFVDRTPWFGRANELSFGMLSVWEYEPDHYYVNNDGAQGAPIASDQTTATNWVWFVEDRHTLSKQWSVVLGAQAVIAQRRYIDTLPTSATYNEEDEQTFHGFSPKIGVIFKPNDDIETYANFSRSFQPPSFDDLVQLGTVAALYAYVPLQAQTANTLEIGARSDAKVAEWELSLYRSWIRNELLEFNNALGNDVGTINAARTYHQGIEAGVTVDLLGGELDDAKSHHLAFEENFTFNDFHFVDDPSNGDNRIASIPVYLYKASLVYQHPGGYYIGPDVTWSPARYPVDQANTDYAPPYAVLGARAGWIKDQHFRVFVQGTNLLNRHYAATVAPIADARATPDPAVFRPGVGIDIMGGIELAW